MRRWPGAEERKRKRKRRKNNAKIHSGVFDRNFVRVENLELASSKNIKFHMGVTNGEKKG